MVTSGCNLRTQEAEDRGPPWGLGQPGIHGETLSQDPTEEERKGRQKKDVMKEGGKQEEREEGEEEKEEKRQKGRKRSRSLCKRGNKNGTRN